VKGTQSTDLLPLTIVNGSKLSVSSLFPYENGQSIFTGTLDPAETLAVLVNTFLLDDQLRLKIDNSEQVNFFLADTAGGINSKGVLLNSPAEITITAAAFGDIDLATHRFLTAVNSSSVVTHYRVQLD
jgi:hypothetical protein